MLTGPTGRLEQHPGRGGGEAEGGQQACTLFMEPITAVTAAI